MASSSNEELGHIAIEKMEPINHKTEVNGLHWQCYLVGSSKTAPRILIFPVALGVNFSLELDPIVS